MDAAACFSREDADIDRCNMTSDMLRFFKIGFLWVNDAFRETAVLVVFSWWVIGCVVAGLRGPYSHVTSLSLSLNNVSIRQDRIMIQNFTNQLSVSGLIVGSWYLLFTHVRHAAFSRRLCCP
jgi:hypothetical protein